MTSFSDLTLIEPLQRSLAAEGYDRPMPIQAKAIPHILEGADLLGLAQTGTGKTAAFALPILQRLTESLRRPRARSMRALVLSPTRELAAQIAEAFRGYGRYLPLRSAVVIGGVGQGPQVRALAKGVDVLIATPGRLVDLADQGHVRFDDVEIFVLDEADRMLDLGFIQPIRKIAAKIPGKRQTLLFSATMPAAIAALAASVQRNPVRIEVTPVASTAERIDQRVLFVDRSEKRALLSDVLKDREIERALVFTRTKRGADRVARQLAQAGTAVGAIHGDKSQGARTAALEGFRSGRLRVLVATDIAARGIDIDGITHVINFDLPDTPEAYVHRIGRTARAGAQGIALSFCDGEERALLRDIEKTIRCSVPVHEDHRFHRGQPAATRKKSGDDMQSDRSARRTRVSRRRPRHAGNVERGLAART